MDFESSKGVQDETPLFIAIKVSYKVALKKINNNKRLLSVLVRAYLQGKSVTLASWWTLAEGQKKHGFTSEISLVGKPYNPEQLNASLYWKSLKTSRKFIQVGRLTLPRVFLREKDC